MKVLVVSDIHGSSYYASKIPEIFEKEKVKDLMDKLKTTPQEVADKL